MTDLALERGGFTAEAAAALAGPSWLRARRGVAAAAFASAELPTTAEEVWRYSRVEELDLARFHVAPAVDGAAADPPPWARVVATAGTPAAVVVVRDGRVVHASVAPAAADLGLAAGPATDGDEAALGAAIETPPDAFVLLNDAFAPEPIVVRVPRGQAVAGPIVVVHWAEADGAATFPRLVVVAGEASAATVLEVQLSAQAGARLVVPVTELVVERAAQLTHVTVQQLGGSTWQLGLQSSRVEADATLRTFTAGLGGEYARLRADCRMVGRGSRAELRAVYFGEDDQMLDFRTFQDHVAPDTTSELVFKGAGAGRSRSVYTGLIHVGPEARRTDAVQTNRNLTLSGEAWAESVPNLQIENNDVRCSHASAVGPVDEEQLFYLESRGVPSGVAERLIVAGFFEEVLADLPLPGVVADLRAAVAAKLARQAAS